MELMREWDAHCSLTLTDGMHLNEGEWQKMLQKERQETDALQTKFTAKLNQYQVRDSPPSALHTHTLKIHRWQEKK